MEKFTVIEVGANKRIILDSDLDIQRGRFGLEMNQTSSQDGAACSKELPVRLSESIFMFPNKKMSEHGNVFEGEIRSGVYGIRSCVLKFADIFEQNAREAKILSELGSHTNVIAIIQSGTYIDILEDRFYIALDKCHEENLKQYLSNRKNAGTKFDLEQASDFTRQIIDGVAYIHDHKVVHLDLKPSNILLSLNQRHIKIADFGLSKELKSTSSKFRPKRQFGTDGYRPAESFCNDWVSLRSDIFSLGAVFYHLLSNGDEVFGDDEHKYIYNVNNNVMDTSGLLVSNPKTTEHLIKLMLSNERCRRPTIWQVAEHPCWTGNEVECSFDYGYAEEIDDRDMEILEVDDQNTESESEAETHDKFVQALKRKELKRRPVRKSSIIIFDKKSKHLQYFNPRNKTVTQMHEYTDEMKKNFFTSVSIDGHIYILMIDVSTEDRPTYRLSFNDATATWERLADLTDDHGWYPPAVVSLGLIIVAGGSYRIFSKSVTKYDPSLNRWEKLKDKQLETRGSTNVSSQEFLYCLGGLIEGMVATDRVERLHVVSQSWDEVASMPEAKSYASGVQCGGNLFVVGGRNHDDEVSNSVEKYNPGANQWTIVKPMTMQRRYFFRCHSIDGKVYAVGRDGFEKYDVDKGEWEVVQILKAENMDIAESVSVKMKE